MSSHGPAVGFDLPASIPLSANNAGWRRALPGQVPSAAVLTWAVLLVIGEFLVRLWDLNPLTTQGVILPIAVGATVGLLLAGAALSVRWPVVVGVVAGAHAAWVGFAIRAMLNGTPYGYGGLVGDSARMSAMATHFTSTWHNTDVNDPREPAEYPPLYPMLVGRLAAWTGHDGWSMLGVAQALVFSAAVLLCFLLWNRVISPPAALLASSSLLVALTNPAKANEVLALGVLLPWLLASFAPPAGRRRLPILVSGIIGGIMVPWYPTLLMLSLVGVLAMMAYGWQRAPDRRSYLLSAGAVVGISALVASWYIVPLVVAYTTRTTDVVADMFLSGSLATQPFAILTSDSPIFQGMKVLGLVGLVVFWRRAWWAPPLAWLLAGVLALRCYMLLRLIWSGHAFLLYYVPYVVGYLLTVAGILTAGRLMQLVFRRRWLHELVPTRAVGIVFVTAWIAMVSTSAWDAWAPTPHGQLDVKSGVRTAPNAATLAHAELLPDLKHVHYAARPPSSRFPATEVADLIRTVRGPNADPVVLSADYRLFAFTGWQCYLSTDRTSSSALVRWDERRSEVRALAEVRDPAAFAQRAAHTTFGPIDALVLRWKKNGWRFGETEFAVTQFDPELWTSQRVSGGFLVLVRKP